MKKGKEMSPILTDGVRLMKHIETADITANGGPNQAARIERVNIDGVLSGGSVIPLSQLDTAGAAVGDVVTLVGVTPAWQAPSGGGPGYLEYSARFLLSAAPVVETVFNNTLGDIPVLSRSNAGQYSLTSNIAQFVYSKTYVDCPGAAVVDGVTENTITYYVAQVGNDVIRFLLSGGADPVIPMQLFVRVLVYP